MVGWYPGVTRVMDNGFGGSRGGAPILGAIPHHVAGFDGRDYVANWNSRSSHPTYHIAANGEVTGIVHPDRRPSSTANGIDAFAITFEIDNIGGAPNWPVSDASLAVLADVIAWHATQSPRAGRPIEVNNPNTEQSGFFVGWHSQYVDTACPGPHVRSLIPAVVATANGITGPIRPKGIPMFAIFREASNGWMYAVGEDGRKAPIQNINQLVALKRLRKAMTNTGEEVEDFNMGDFTDPNYGDLDRILNAINGPHTSTPQPAPVWAPTPAELAAIGAAARTDIPALLAAIAKLDDAEHKELLAAINRPRTLA